ncbi:MAG: DUF4123 domain-containing protein [Verrucomicrobiota bacterium]
MNASEKAESSRPALLDVLFGEPDKPIFAVLDGASAPGLVKNLYEHEPEYCCLYRGELSPDVATVAPYLVRLEPAAKFAELVLREGWGAHWGIFVASAASLRALRDHFREFHTVELPDQRTVLFRYYDPRVLRCFLPACNAAELATFFGPVQSFVVEGDTPESGVRFALAGKALKPEPFQLKKPS